MPTFPFSHQPSHPFDFVYPQGPPTGRHHHHRGLPPRGGMPGSFGPLQGPPPVAPHHPHHPHPRGRGPAPPPFEGAQSDFYYMGGPPRAHHGGHGGFDAPHFMRSHFGPEERRPRGPPIHFDMAAFEDYGRGFGPHPHTGPMRGGPRGPPGGHRSRHGLPPFGPGLGPFSRPEQSYGDHPPHLRAHGRGHGHPHPRHHHRDPNLTPPEFTKPHDVEVQIGATPFQVVLDKGFQNGPDYVRLTDSLGHTWGFSGVKGASLSFHKRGTISGMTEGGRFWKIKSAPRFEGRHGRGFHRGPPGLFEGLGGPRHHHHHHHRRFQQNFSDEEQSDSQGSDEVDYVIPDGEMSTLSLSSASEASSASSDSEDEERVVLPEINEKGKGRARPQSLPHHHHHHHLPPSKKTGISNVYSLPEDFDKDDFEGEEVLTFVARCVPTEGEGVVGTGKDDEEEEEELMAMPTEGPSTGVETHEEAAEPVDGGEGSKPRKHGREHKHKGRQEGRGHGKVGRSHGMDGRHHRRGEGFDIQHWHRPGGGRRGAPVGEYAFF